ncbi:MAG: hypothetical protein MHM6MM_005695 [Cercozoa sp. M6MM]
MGQSGAVFVCPRLYDNLESTSWTHIVNTLLHETLHALVLNSESWESFIDVDTGRSVPRSSVIRTEKAKYSDSPDRSFVITPTVKKLLAAQFDREVAEQGLLLENEDGGNHLESRVFYHSLMSASTSPAYADVIDMYPFAVMHDSGHYRVDLDHVASGNRQSPWGRQHGLDFYVGDCVGRSVSTPHTKFPGHFDVMSDAIEISRTTLPQLK